jgi:predicted acyl esterase
MENNKIIKAISAIFGGADERDWNKVSSAMSDSVWLDYSSLSGNPAATLPSSQIIETWRNFLPGFDKTHHQLFNFRAVQSGNTAVVNYSGKADHFIGADVWTVEGDYVAELVNTGNRWLVTKLQFNLSKQSGNTTLPSLAIKNINDKKTVNIQKVKFQSDGLTLAGNLYTPAGLDDNKRYPAIIADGSWTTVKEQMQALYAKALAEKGYVVLAFDHRYFGESEGQPREYENHDAKVQDIKDAVTYLQSLSFVDKDKIAGLGVCASGAYMMQATAEDHRIKALATVVAWLMTPETAKLFYGGDEGTKARIDKALASKKKFAETGTADYVPAYDPNNMDAAMFFPVDYYARPERGAIPNWRNNFAVMSWEKWLTYDGVASSKTVDVPVIMIASEKQFLPDGSKAAFSNFSNKNKKTFWLNQYEHTDFYDNPKAITEAVENISHQLNAWLN